MRRVPAPEMTDGSCRLPARFLETHLDSIPDLRFQRDAVETVDLLPAGRRGDVDTGEIAADHVDADEQQAASGELRPDDLAQFPVALAERVLHRHAADMHVRTRFALGRHAVDDADGLAVDQDDALVALAHLRKVPLSDHGLAAARGEHLEHEIDFPLLRPPPY